MQSESPRPTDRGTEPTASEHYDVVIIGGGFCGGAAALLLRRSLPSCRVLLLDRNETTTHKVGEATVEVSALFMMRVLKISDHLGREHLPKHGLRFWFTDQQGRSLREMSEVGPASPPPLSTFQLDRSVLDEHLLELARAEGAEVARPCTVRSWNEGWPLQSLTYETADGEMRTVTCRWLLDASGKAAFVARRKKLLERTEDHTTTAVWGRWQGVRDLDGPAVLGFGADTNELPPIAATRRLATNHFCGPGWWCWMIPLACGKTSVGLVFDHRIFHLPGEGDARARYEAFVRSQDGLRELLQDATLDPDDTMAYRHLPYCSRQFADRGWALLGDAGMFLDPFYSPGLDQASISTFATLRLLESDLEASEEDPKTRQEALDTALEKHNGRFSRSYRRWLEALYLGKYRLMGDAELASCAFLVDTALYYLGVVGPAYRHTEALANPVFGIELPQARWAYLFTRTFNRRLQRLAELRQRQGTFGRRNVGWRPRISAFRTGPGALRPLLQGMVLWLRMELSAMAGSLTGRGRLQPTDSVRHVPL
jgi:flavin-dependent dehydrogenase